MYFVDTNIWLEYLLDQEKAIECEKFLKVTPDKLIYISDFALASIGIITTKKSNTLIYEEFLKDTFKNGEVNLISLTLSDQFKLLENIRSYKLDFDDAYQLTCVNKYNLTLVSFDSDFDKSPVKRKVPSELIT
ncbi:MAG: type II toxin-antitoxin system VapC family toxin [Ignavibacteriae bacterium]|nr:type II toxin-antitoxin system VapC family toxin [Ignavibacteriota bacterium]